MKNLVIIIITILSPILLFSQNLEVEGQVKVSQMNPDNSATLIVVKQADGTLAVRDASTLTDGDSDMTNEIQDLSLVGDILTITLNGSATQIDLSGYLDNTDEQDLTLTGNVLSISNDPNTDVDLTPYLDNTDEQTLSEVLTQDNDAANNTIINLADPISNQDAATKAYVDLL